MLCTWWKAFQWPQSSLPKGDWETKAGTRGKKLAQPYEGTVIHSDSQKSHMFLSALNMKEDKRWMYDALLNGHAVDVVIDSFASHNFMAYEDTKKLWLTIEMVKKLDVELKDSSKTARRSNRCIEPKRTHFQRENSPYQHEWRDRNSSVDSG